MKKLLNSLPVTILVIVLLGAVGAYKSISRRERANAKAQETQLKEDVAKSIGNIKIEMPPLSQAGSNQNKP
jgi:hypothetical protein